MKRKRPIFCFLLAAIICINMVTSASAAFVLGTLTEGYGYITGTTSQDYVFLNSTVHVNKNEDLAYLRIKLLLTSSSNIEVTPEITYTSSRGVATFEHEYYMVPGGPGNPSYGYATYEVYGGTEYDAAAYYYSFDIDETVFNMHA